MAELQHKYLRLADLRRLRNVLFAPRRPVEGRYAGRHTSPQRGHSVEFTDYRPYMPGDEPADIDWKVFARSDRLFVKLFEHQSDMTVHVVVDGSASMGYAGIKGPRPSAIGLDSKFDYACRMAAAIAFLTTRQQDRVSFSVACGGLNAFIPPQSTPSHMLQVLAAMERVQPQGTADLAGALTDLAARVERRGLVVVLSDLLDEADEVLRAMSGFTHRGSEVIVFHVMHGDELHLPALDDVVFIDSETRRRTRLNVPDIREAYVQRLEQFLHHWSSACRSRGFEYHLANASQPYHKALESYLFARAGR